MTWTYNGQDVKVMFYQDGTTPGAAPSDWESDSTVFAVATGFSQNTSKEVNGKYGFGNQTPQLLKEGQITYEWSVDNLYTTTDYGGNSLLDMINGGQTFALYIQTLDSTGSEDSSVELLFCEADQDNLEGSEDGDVTCNLSGQAKTRNVTTV